MIAFFLLLLQHFYIAGATSPHDLEGYYYFDPRNAKPSADVVRLTGISRAKSRYMDVMPSTTHIEVNDDETEIILSVYFSNVIYRQKLLAIDGKWHDDYDQDIGPWKQSCSFSDDTLTYRSYTNSFEMVQTFTIQGNNLLYKVDVATPGHHKSSSRSLTRANGSHVRERSRIQFSNSGSTGRRLTFTDNDIIYPSNK